MVGVRGHRGHALLVVAAIVAALAVVLVLLGGGASARAPHLALRDVGAFDQPVYVTHAPGTPGVLYVVGQTGRIRVVDHGTARPKAFLNISSRVSCCGERGLLSIAFDPRFRSNHLLYADFTNVNGNLEVDQFRATSDLSADPASRRRVIVVPHPGESNHNGGQLQFGPDGFLYISTGDGGDMDDTHHNAQDRTKLLRKILRISPGNPTAPLPGNIPGTLIYDYGLRNPWRFSFDRLTGDMIIGDVGQGAEEEIDFIHPWQGGGFNFGWPCWEGTGLNNGGSVQSYPECNPTPAQTGPVHEYAHSGGAFSGAGIIGGFVVRDHGLPELYGRYLYGDLSSSASKGLRSLALTQPSATDDQPVALNISALSSFGEDAGGCIY